MHLVPIIECSVERLAFNKHTLYTVQVQGEKEEEKTSHSLIESTLNRQGSIIN